MNLDKIYFNTEPFNYWIIDDFFPIGQAITLASKFPDYNDTDWYVYDNPLEVKKTINNYYKFSPEIYATMFRMMEPMFVEKLERLCGSKLFPDYGLHGAGMHIHGNGGKINLHLDYSTHPKLPLQRKLNLIVYLSETWNTQWGGNLEFWSHDMSSNKPLEKKQTIECKYNRAVIFDTSQNAWHGFPDPIQCPDTEYRKSLAMYYLCNPNSNIQARKRALYAPTPEQQSDQGILDLIIERSQ